MIVIGELSARGALLDSRSMTETAQQVSKLIVFGGIIALLIMHHRAARLLRDKAARDEQRIRESDELRVFINDRSSTLTLELLAGAGVIALLIFSYLDMTAFTTAYCAMITGLLLKGIAYFCCKHRVV